MWRLLNKRELKNNFDNTDIIYQAEQEKYEVYESSVGKVGCLAAIILGYSDVTLIFSF